MEIIFVGSYGHMPNVDAAHYLVRHVMPQVWLVAPDVHVMLIGSNPTEAIYKLAENRVSVIGYVPDILPYYQRARVSVSPLRFGAGVKGKIVASLEHGVPVVTTPIGNEGLNLLSGSEVLVGETSEQIASCVLRLIKDDSLWLQLSSAGLDIVKARFGEETAKKALETALKIRGR